MIVSTSKNMHSSSLPSLSVTRTRMHHKSNVCLECVFTHFSSLVCFHFGPDPLNKWFPTDWTSVKSDIFIWECACDVMCVCVARHRPRMRVNIFYYYYFNFGFAKHTTSNILLSWFCRFFFFCHSVSLRLIGSLICVKLLDRGRDETKYCIYLFVLVRCLTTRFDKTRTV